jgi:hypothetical protein
MTIHQCPKCELRFDWKTELDDHCRHDHPEFRHEYPAVPVAAEQEPEPVAPPHPHEQRHAHLSASALGAWLRPTRPRAGDGSDRRPPPQ